MACVRKWPNGPHMLCNEPHTVCYVMGLLCFSGALRMFVTCRLSLMTFVAYKVCCLHVFCLRRLLLPTFDVMMFFVLMFVILKFFGVSAGPVI